MNTFVKNIKNSLPQKEDHNKNDKFNSYKIQLGKVINHFCFKNNIGDNSYSKIFSYLNNQKWDEIIQNDVKHYYYNDLQLIINAFGHQCCKKEKVFSYCDFNYHNYDIRFMLSRYIPIPPVIFPPKDEYHDMRKIKSIRYLRNNVTYELLIVNNLNKTITYEFNMFSSVFNLDKLLQELFFLINFLDNNTVKFKHFHNHYISNSDFNKLSLSILL